MDKDSRAIRTNHIAMPSNNSDETKSALYGLLVSLINLVNGKISLGTGENQTFAGNVQGLYIDALTPAAPNTDFTLYHNLDYIPQCVILVRSDRAVTIYQSSQAADTKTITLKATVASATIKVWIF